MIDVLRYKLLNIFNNNNWYDRVYLCYEKIEDEKPNTYFSIVGFNCYKFNSFENANKNFNLRSKFKRKNIRQTTIPICKWIPNIFDKYILNYKLKKIYWLGKISIYHNIRR